MGSTIKSIEKLLENIDANELVLPEIQRDFVWKKKNVLLLFDSLYRELPIGYMLVWKAKTAVAHKKFKKQTKIKYGQSIDGFYGYLLDGQQRLTAIQLVREGDENYPLMFSLWPGDENIPDENRFFFSSRKSNDPWSVSVCDIISGNIKPLQILDRLKGLDDFDYHSDAEKVLAAVTKLQGIMDYKVGVIEFEDNDYKKATELFIRFNSTGRKLNRNDLVAAELALNVPSLVSEGVNKVSMMYAPSFLFTKNFLIQCLIAVHKSRLKFEDLDQIWDGSEPSEINNSWKLTSKGFSRTIDLLTGTVKWDSETWMPSINSIIPLVYLLSQGKFSHKERLLARKWLLVANIYKLFSKSAHTELDRILRGLKKDPSIEKLINLTKKYMGKIKPEHFETRRKSGAAMSLFISMIRNMNAKDWVSRTPLDGRVLGHNAELQVHHFFPKALLSSQGFSPEDTNTFANYTIINKDTNLDISDEEPVEYIKRLKIGKNDLNRQCIPWDKYLWSVGSYEDFLVERKKLLAKNANLFLNKK